MRAERKESAIEASFTRACEREGWKVRKLSYPGRRGASDRMVVARFPYVAFAEVKRPGEEPSPLQDIEHGDLHGMGHPVFLIRTEADIRRFVDRVKTWEGRL